ncbi:MAG TPA: hypothetical protein VGU63_14805, partial [Candidatus Acidoferrales bacterium]|nr:hypothetical protein [Candidatus Acidoferrales bacterium]
MTNRKSIFGHIIGDKMECNRAGEAVWNVWRELPVRFPIVDLDAFVVMPNHVHGILLLCPPKTGGRASPAPTNAIVNAGRRGDPWVARRDSPNRAHHRGHFGDIIGAFKSLSAVAVNGVLHQTGSIWQRNYYEHVVRNGEDLDAIRLY